MPVHLEQPRLHRGGGLLEVRHLLHLQVAHAEFVRRWPDGIASLSHVRAGTPHAGDEVRKGLAKLMASYDKVTRCAVTVLEERGVAGSTLRAIARGLNVLSRMRMMFLARSEEAIPILLPHLEPKGGVTEKQLRTAIEQARARSR